MRVRFKANEVRDFAQRYTNSFGWATRTDGTKELVMVSRVYDEHLIVENTNKEFRRIPVNSTVLFEFIPAVRGWHNTTFGPVFFQRNPQRQWARGINENNTVATLHNMKRCPLNMDLLSAVKWGDYEFTGNYPIALSKYFMLGKVGVYCHTREVGFHIGGVLTVASWIYQELTDLVRRNNLPLKVNIEQDNR